MESLLAHVARREQARLRIAQIDVDLRPDLAQRFGVSVVPTLLLIKDRRVVERLEGRASAPRIDEMLAPHLGAAEVAPDAAAPAASAA